MPPQPIFYSDVSPDQSIDINNDGVMDFTLSGGQDINLWPLNNNAIISVPELPPDWGAFIYALRPGETISSSLDPVFVWWDASAGPCEHSIRLKHWRHRLLRLQYRSTYAGIRLDVAGALSLRLDTH